MIIALLVTSIAPVPANESAGVLKTLAPDAATVTRPPLPTLIAMSCADAGKIALPLLTFTVSRPAVGTIVTGALAPVLDTLIRSVPPPASTVTGMFAAVELTLIVLPAALALSTSFSTVTPYVRVGEPVLANVLDVIV